jgi:hypothetical protein
VQRFEVLPAHARSVFAPLQLQGEPAFKPTPMATPRAPEPAKAVPEPLPSVAPHDEDPIELARIEAKPVEAKPVETKPIEVRLPSVPMPDRAGSRTSPPPATVSIPEPMTAPTRSKEPTQPRTKEPTQPFGTPAVDVKRAGPPPPPPPSTEDLDDEEWPAISRDEQTDKPVTSS